MLPRLVVSLGIHHQFLRCSLGLEYNNNQPSLLYCSQPDRRELLIQVSQIPGDFVSADVCCAWVWVLLARQISFCSTRDLWTSSSPWLVGWQTNALIEQYLVGIGSFQPQFFGLISFSYKLFPTIYQAACRKTSYPVSFGHSIFFWKI